MTDPADLPAERTAYAMRDLEHLKRLASEAGPAVGAYATAVLDHPLPWTKMRQSTPCWAWSNGGVPTGSRPPAAGLSTPKASMSTSSAACPTGPPRRPPASNPSHRPRHRPSRPGSPATRSTSPATAGTQRSSS